MKIIWTNKIVEQLTGRDRNEIIGEFCYKLFTGRDEPCPNCPTMKSIKSGKLEHSIICEENVKGIDGISYWADYAVPVKNESGETENFIQVSRDISELKEAEAELLEEKRKLEIALSHAKKLSGLLPICTHCKKIRDDKGYWNQIESYLEKHSDASLSYSICRECAKKYYPDYDIYND